jgi:hypothetical protein
VVVQPNGEWTTKITVGKGSRGVGKQFVIFPVLAPESGSLLSAWVRCPFNWTWPD